MKDFLKSPLKKKQYFLITVDGLLVLSVFILSYIFRIVFFEGSNAILVWQRLTWLLLFAVCCHLFNFYIFELYNINYKRSNFSLLLYVSTAVIISVGLIAILSYFFPKAKIGRVLLGFHVPIVIAVIFLWRKLSYHIMEKSFAGNNLLLLGSDSFTERIKEDYLPYYYSEYQLCGVVSDFDEHTGVLIYNGSKYDSGFKNLIETNHIKTLVIADDLKLSPELKSELIDLRFQGVEIYDVPTFTGKLFARIPVNITDAEWLLFANQDRSFRPAIYLKIKRVIDLLVSLFGLIFLSPLLLIIAIVVKLTSKGPVFFKQERLGLNEEPFTLIKFRTMIENAEKATGPKWSSKDDPRITPIGRFLRRTRLDEIPQLYNIFKGEMSIIGPRPIRKHFADKLGEKFPFYRLRFMVKPGVSGWAQVNGGYAGSEEAQLEKLEYELFYIKNQSLFLDLIIFFKTIQTVLFRRGE